ncbi:MAG: hypothetical protein R2807_01670 [Chitinophagales bacterium]
MNIFNKNNLTEHYFNKLSQEILINRMLQGKLMTVNNKLQKSVQNLEDVEFKVFSQWGDDGIIQYLISQIEIPNKTFVEFGVENYTEANTRFLLMNNNWSGLIMDGSEENMNYVRNDSIYWKYDLQCKAAFIDTENVNSLIASAGFDKELGILHIDIDGNDYWVWKAVHVVQPIIVIIEYNSLFGFDKPWTTPYNPTFFRTNYHYSNLLYGTSLLSACDLANEKGYTFVGCNSAGNNAYFVRNDKVGNLYQPKIEEGYRLSKFKESRSKDGALTYLRADERYNLLKGENVFNTRTNQLEQIK